MIFLSVEFKSAQDDGLTEQQLSEHITRWEKDENIICVLANTAKEEGEFHKATIQLKNLDNLPYAFDFNKKLSRVFKKSRIHTMSVSDQNGKTGLNAQRSFIGEWVITNKDPDIIDQKTVSGNPREVRAQMIQTFLSKYDYKEQSSQILDIDQNKIHKAKLNIKMATKALAFA